MAGTRKHVVAASLIASLAPVWSMRNEVASKSLSVEHAMQSISEVLRQGDMGSQDLLSHLSQYATPGAGKEYGEILKEVMDKTEKLEKKVRDGQEATQTKLDTLFKNLEEASIGVYKAKEKADVDDEAWFECAAAEQAARQEAEGVAKAVQSSRSTEKEACQRHQDNKDFTFDAAGKYKDEFACKFSAGSCDAAYQTYQKAMLQVKYDASTAMAKDKATYNILEAACKNSTQKRIKAQSAVTEAESAWSKKRAECVKLESTRQSSFCAFGSSLQAKCRAQSTYSRFVASTKKAKGDAHSEVDRSSEWMGLQTAKCTAALAMQKGLDTAVTSADVDDCVAKVSFARDVGSLNTRQADFKKLVGSNKCAAGEIAFFNGQKWNVPKGSKPQSSAYGRAAFTPQLNPVVGNFDFCK